MRQDRPGLHSAPGPTGSSRQQVPGRAESPGFPLQPVQGTGALAQLRNQRVCQGKVPCGTPGSLQQNRRQRRRRSPLVQVAETATAWSGRRVDRVELLQVSTRQEWTAYYQIRSGSTAHGHRKRYHQSSLDRTLQAYSTLSTTKCLVQHSYKTACTGR